MYSRCSSRPQIVSDARSAVPLTAMTKNADEIIGALASAAPVPFADVGGRSVGKSGSLSGVVLTAHARLNDLLRALLFAAAAAAAYRSFPHAGFPEGSADVAHGKSVPRKSRPLQECMCSVAGGSGVPDSSPAARSVRWPPAVASLPGSTQARK